MKKKLIIGIFFIFGISIFAEQTYVKGKILSILREEELVDDEYLTSMTDFKVEIMEGEEKGKILTIPHPTYREKQHNLFFKPNMNVVIYRDTDDYYIVERDRSYASLDRETLEVMLRLNSTKLANAIVEKKD